MRHHCHAHGCKKIIPRKLFVCRPHWYRIRKPLRDAIWREYRPGQERDKKPSMRYLAVQQLAVCELAFKPNDEKAATVAAFYMDKALHFQRMAIGAGLGDPLDGLVQA